jgi:putative addiction module CopG family antidote
MALKSRNISLPPELDALIADRVRSGLYGDASEVVRAGLRALAREKMGASVKEFEDILASLPDGPPLTPEIEEDVEQRIRMSREAEGRKPRK